MPLANGLQGGNSWLHVNKALTMSPAKSRVDALEEERELPDHAYSRGFTKGLIQGQQARRAWGRSED